MVSAFSIQFVMIMFHALLNSVCNILYWIFISTFVSEIDLDFSYNILSGFGISIRIFLFFESM